MQILEDSQIKGLLRLHDRNGTLGAVAENCGVAGGVDTLRGMMEQTDELSVLDRGMLSLSLTTLDGYAMRRDFHA